MAAPLDQIRLLLKRSFVALVLGDQNRTQSAVLAGGEYVLPAGRDLDRHQHPRLDKGLKIKRSWATSFPHSCRWTFPFPLWGRHTTGPLRQSVSSLFTKNSFNNLSRLFFFCSSLLINQGRDHFRPTESDPSFGPNSDPLRHLHRLRSWLGRLFVPVWYVTSFYFSLPSGDTQTS